MHKYVSINEKIRVGQIIADGTSTEGGELAVGQNILIAYSQLLFAMKETKEAFKAFESRKRTPSYRMLLDNLKMDEWKGENLNGKSILIVSEQGIGDLLQFARYLFYLADQYNCEVILRLKQNLSHFFDDKRIKIIC